MTKEEFLKKLISPSSGKYKRYKGSPLRYAGGKSLAVGYIVELIPNYVRRIISPFIGGGSVEIALAKELGLEVIAYDIFDLLVNYWQQQLKHPKELYDLLATFRPTKEEYERIKNILKKHWDKSAGYDGELEPLELAAYYYFNMQLSYGPGFLGWMSSIYTSEKKYASTIQKVKTFCAPTLKVKLGSFENIMAKYKNDFLYLDPPYFLEGDSRMFRGLYPMRNFPIHHNRFNHKKLSELLKNHKGGFILSYNNCSWIRNEYKDCKIIEVGWQYTMGQGETRIGKNRLQRDYDNNNIKTSHELLIVGEKR